MCLTINADNLNVVHWWVDAAYGVHNDLKDHTGSTMSVRKGGVTRITRKQKINTTSSTQEGSVYTILPHKLCGRSISFRTKGSMTIPPFYTKI